MTWTIEPFQMNKYLLGFLCLLFVGRLSAQNVYTDFQSWNALSIEKKVTKNWRIEAEYETRFAENASMIESNLITTAARYKINKNFRLKLGYRLNNEISKRKGNYFENRLFSDLNTKFEYKRFSISIRERYQVDLSTDIEDAFGSYTYHMIRHKTQFAYNLPKTKLEPFAAIEVFQSLNNPYKNGIDKIRTSMGVQFPIKKIADVELMYRYQIRNNYISKYLKSHIAGLKVSFTL